MSDFYKHIFIKKSKNDGKNFTHNKCNLVKGQITQSLKKPQSCKHMDTDGKRDGEDNNDIQRTQAQ